MSPLGPITSSLSSLPIIRPEELSPARANPETSPAGSPAQPGFSNLLDGLVNSVAGKESHADDLTRQVLLGQSGQLHQSVIAMQEASVAFSLMVQVRNKLVDSYQELMRMQV